MTYSKNAYPHLRSPAEMRRLREQAEAIDKSYDLGVYEKVIHSVENEYRGQYAVVTFYGDLFFRREAKDAICQAIRLVGIGQYHLYKVGEPEAFYLR